MCSWLGGTARLTCISSQDGGHDAGHMGDGEMRCGDMGKEMAAKAGLGHSDCRGPTTEDGLVS